MHNYVKKFYSMIQRGELVVAEGSYNDIEFLHDHWCGIYRGKECNCDPDVVLHREAVTSPRKAFNARDVKILHLTIEPKP
jgi:hypothetical protein